MRLTRTTLLLALATLALTLGVVTFAFANNQMTEVTITNLSNTVITPPILALSNKKITPFYTLGETASVELEILAEGGDGTALLTTLAESGAETYAHDAPIGPGETITISIPSRSRTYLQLGAMILPTNDAFVALSNLQVRGKRESVAYLNAYDAGTENNTETCDQIPGPQCGGEGFNTDRDDINIVHPHPGLHGNEDVSEAEYNWGDPVLKVSARIVK